MSAVDIWSADLPDVPDNLDIQFWNLNDPLTRLFDPNTFDLIHSRCVGPGIKRSRWNSYITELARLLRRGGWLQMAEYYYNIQSDSGRLREDHAMYKWGVTYRGLMEDDRDPRVGRSLVDKMRNAGFRDVYSHTYRIPIGPWSGGMYDPSLRFISVTISVGYTWAAACEGDVPRSFANPSNIMANRLQSYEDEVRLLVVQEPKGAGWGRFRLCFGTRNL